MAPQPTQPIWKYTFADGFVLRVLHNEILSGSIMPTVRILSRFHGTATLEGSQLPDYSRLNPQERHDLEKQAGRRFLSDEGAMRYWREQQIIGRSSIS